MKAENTQKSSAVRRSAVILTVLLAAAVVTLTALLAGAQTRLTRVKNECADNIFSSLQIISLNLPRYEEIDEPGIIAGVPEALMRIDTSRRRLESLSGDGKTTPDGSGFDLLATIFGGRMNSAVNGMQVKSLLSDGRLSEGEHEYLRRFNKAVDSLLSDMTDSGYSIKPGYGCEDMRGALLVFLDEWTGTGADSPMALLSGD